jgi:outer membrane protein OmpA-like peptidoglycan-associated protein
MGLVGAAMVSLVAVGCQNKLRDENLAFRKQNLELQQQNDQLRANQADPNQVASLQSQIAERDAKINDLQSQLRQPPPPQAGVPTETASDLAGIEVTRDVRAGTVTVNLPGDVLFLSGKADLKESAKSTLNKVVHAIQKDYSGKMIYVDGYADTDPVNKTKDKWKDNLDLSAARARTVAQYLETRGISSTHVIPRGMNTSNPKRTKDASRRVEIVVATRS